MWHGSALEAFVNKRHVHLGRQSLDEALFHRGEARLELRALLLHLRNTSLGIEAPLHLGHISLGCECRLHLRAPGHALYERVHIARVGLVVDDSRELLESVAELARAHLFRQQRLVLLPIDLASDRLLDRLERLAVRLDDIVQCLEVEPHNLLHRLPLYAANRVVH